MHAHSFIARRVACNAVRMEKDFPSGNGLRDRRNGWHPKGEAFFREHEKGELSPFKVKLAIHRLKKNIDCYLDGSGGRRCRKGETPALKEDAAAIPDWLKQKLAGISGERKISDALWYCVNNEEARRFNDWQRELRKRHPKIVVEIDPGDGKIVPVNMEGSSIVLENDRKKLQWALESGGRALLMLNRTAALKSLLPVPEGREIEAELNREKQHGRRDFLFKVAGHCEIMLDELQESQAF